MAHRLIVIASVLALLLTPTYASAHMTGLRSPDVTPSGVVTVKHSSSLQSPDARDSAHATAMAGQPTPGATSSDDGSSWLLEVGIAAAAGLAFGMVLVASRRRHQTVKA